MSVQGQSTYTTRLADGMWNLRDIQIRYMLRGHACILPLPDVDKLVEGVSASLQAGALGVEITLAECRLEGFVEIQVPCFCYDGAEVVGPEACIDNDGTFSKKVLYTDSLLTVVMWIDFNATLCITFRHGANNDTLGMRGEAVMALKARVFLSPPLLPPPMLGLYLSMGPKSITWNRVRQRHENLWFCGWYLDRRFCDYVWEFVLAQWSWKLGGVVVMLCMNVPLGILDIAQILFVVVLCKQFPALSTSWIVRWTVVVLKWDLWLAALLFSAKAALTICLLPMALLMTKLASSPAPAPAAVHAPTTTITTTTTVLIDEQQLTFLVIGGSLVMAIEYGLIASPLLLVR